MDSSAIDGWTGCYTGRVDIDDERRLRQRYSTISAVPQGCDHVWVPIGGGWEACAQEACGWHRLQGSDGRVGLHHADGRECQGVSIETD